MKRHFVKVGMSYYVNPWNVCYVRKDWEDQECSYIGFTSGAGMMDVDDDETPLRTNERIVSESAESVVEKLEAAMQEGGEE